MRVSVFGLGHVGLVSAACLVKDGHEVVAVDPNEGKIAALNRGLSQLSEPGVDEILAREAGSGRLRGVEKAREAILATDISLICVSTPVRFNGAIDTDPIVQAMREIGAALRHKSTFHTIFIRTTVLPGTTDDLLIPTLERACGKRLSTDFAVCYYPEFIRRGSAIKDYYEPTSVVLGVRDPDPRVERAFAQMIEMTGLEPTIVPIRAAEAIKYANRCWEALKFGFSSEIKNICRALGIDGEHARTILGADAHLVGPDIANAALGDTSGPRLPPDAHSIGLQARQLDIATPLIDATMSAHERQTRKAFDLVSDIRYRPADTSRASATASAPVSPDSPEAKLSSRELECLRWRAKGKSDWDTGQIIGISERTVKFHLENARTKLDVMNTTHAVSKALSLNLFEL